ncbi:UNVERIFIED_CONTAM: hypothetical protein GTU68_021294 [Idotea baltica]|nr:hypothetical protein [Idotea baltica]
MTFPLLGTIKGFQIGISKIKEGGKILLIVPPKLGFGTNGIKNKIPPNSILVYEIELIEVSN